MTLLARCPWYVAGPSIGVLLILLRATLNKPFGAMGGIIELVEKKARWSRFGASAFLLIGIFFGGVMFGIASRSLEPTLSYAAIAWLPTGRVSGSIVLVAAGVVMGFGARLAGGCTSGHGLSGMSLASPASIAATVTFFATAVLLAHLYGWLAGGLS